MKKDRDPQDLFIDLDVRKLEQIEAERKKILIETMQIMPELHFMRCPRCSFQLEESFISDIIVFICKQCAGIWMDADICERILQMDCDRTASRFQTKTE